MFCFCFSKATGIQCSLSGSDAYPTDFWKSPLSTSGSHSLMDIGGHAKNFELFPHETHDPLMVGVFRNIRSLSSALGRSSVGGRQGTLRRRVLCPTFSLALARAAARGPRELVICLLPEATLVFTLVFPACGFQLPACGLEMGSQ